MARNHIIVGTKGGKPEVLYIGDNGGLAERAYETAKGMEQVEHFRFPVPSRKRGGAAPSAQPVVRQWKPKAEAPAKPERHDRLK